MSELEHGDLAEVRDVGSSKQEPRLARYNADRCKPTEACDPSCCVFWSFFGTEFTSDAEAIEVVRRVRTVDCE